MTLILNNQEIQQALGPIIPAPVGAYECLVTGGVLSRATVELRFAPTVLRRDALDMVFGEAEALPRTGPDAAHKLVYTVRVDNAPARVALFAFFREAPRPASEVATVLLRIDPANVAYA